MPLESNALLHNRYRILAELGRGGMGAVYKALDENLGVEVAIKENLFTSPESERQFRREASLLAGLRHPHLPRVVDHFVVPGQGQYLVMDYIPGEDARTRLERIGAPLPEREVVRWAREILGALRYLHYREQPILHRDIKPGNIKITPEDRAVLVDFGLAKVSNTGDSTTIGAKAFTPGFAPPEQYGLGRTDPRTDIYALGATLYNLLTVQMPADAFERLMGNSTLVPVRTHNAGVSLRMAAAIERALSVKPEDRFATADEFADALPALDEYTQLARAEATLAKPAPAASAPAPVAAPRRSPWPMLAGVVGALAVVGVGGWLAVQALGGPTAPPTATEAPTLAATATPAPSVTPVPPTDTPAPTATEAPSASPVPPTDTPAPTATETATAGPVVTPRGGGTHGQIAFVSERVGGLPQIFLMNTDGTEVRQLTQEGEGACQPAWSPDGAQLAFITPCTRKTDTYPRAIIYVSDVDAQGNASPSRQLVSLVGGVFDPDWSLAGLAFTYNDSGRLRIYMADANGANPRALSRGTAVDSQPSWSPGGERLVFKNISRSGRPELYWMNQDGTFNGSVPDQVTRDLDADLPTWSPAGDLVAFVNGRNIFTIRWDAKGFNVNQLTTVEPNDGPAWAPDGQWLAFESWRAGANHDIYIMTQSGSQQTRLTDDPAWDYQPAWRP